MKTLQVPIMKKKILLAESKPVHAAYYQKILSNMGWECDVVSEHENVVNCFCQDYEAVFISDDATDKSRSVATTRSLREKARACGKNVKIFGITPFSHDPSSRNLKEAGMDEVVSQPIYRNTLSGLLDFS